jgi:hypothetical protein
MKKNKLTKRQLEKFARIHIAVHSSYIDGSAFDDCGLSEDEIEKCVNAVSSLSDKIRKNLPGNFVHNKEILEYVRKHF